MNATNSLLLTLVSRTIVVPKYAINATLKDALVARKELWCNGTIRLSILIVSVQIIISEVALNVYANLKLIPKSTTTTLSTANASSVQLVAHVINEVVFRVIKTQTERLLK